MARYMGFGLKEEFERKPAVEPRAGSVLPGVGIAREVVLGDPQPGMTVAQAPGRQSADGGLGQRHIEVAPGLVRDTGIALLHGQDILVFLDVQLADGDEQAEIRDFLEKPAQRVCRKDALRQIQMRLQAHAVERDAGALQPFEELEEKMASIVFDPQIILEAEFIDHQLRPGRQLARLPQRPRNVVGAEGLQERTVSQAVRPMAGLYRFIDDIPLRNCMAIAREHGLEVSLHERPSLFLDQ